MNKERQIFYLLGFDIGGTKIAVSLAASNGEILACRRLPNQDTRPERVLPELVKTARELLSGAGLRQSDIAAIGIGSPSPADIPNGIIVAPPNNRYWKNVPIRDYLAEHLGAEAFFDNDANAGALAEWMFGAGRGCENMVYLTMSTGIGGGIIANGRLIRGANCYAGEIGHAVIAIDGPECNCGLHGCYESFCGGAAVAGQLRREFADQPGHPIVRQAGGKPECLDMAALAAAVRDGNADAVRRWDDICLRNAQAIGILINVLNPERIILGTIAKATGELFMKPLMQYLPRFCWQEPRDACRIVICELPDIGNYAGIAVALNFLYEQGRFSLPWQNNPTDNNYKP